MTVNVLASGPWPAARPEDRTPSQPVALDRSCACSSWPSEILTVMSAQLMPAPVEPSSGSVIETLYGILSVKDATWPSSGISIVTVGARLPTEICTLLTAVRPVWSVTVSLAV